MEKMEKRTQAQDDEIQMINFLKYVLTQDIILIKHIFDFVITQWNRS